MSSHCYRRTCNRSHLAGHEREEGAGEAEEDGSVTDVEAGRADRASDLRRFETLFLDHADAVLAYAARRSDPDTAQEVVADTFVVAWRRLAAVPDPALPWLLGVAKRILANERRATRRAQALTLRLIREPRRHGEDEPTDEVDERLSAQAALLSLPSREREVLELLAWEGLSTAEAAEVLACSRRLVAVRVHRARRRLRKQIDEAHQAPPSGRLSKEQGKQEGHHAPAIEGAKEAR
jgi:RNA polymerase sigma-70 factor (ECF subfamily)